MAVDLKPLFRPEALRPHLAAFALPASAPAGRAALARWAKLLGSKAGQKMKETELRDEFLYDVFRDLLGYTTATQNPAAYSLTKEQYVQVDGTFADAGFGRFGGTTPTTVAVLEGKSPLDPLDRPYHNRKRSAFEQALLYAYNQRCDWFLVTNLREIRLYHKGGDQLTYERFLTEKLAADPAEFTRFVFLLGADRVVPPAGPCHLDALLTASKKVGRDLTADFYREYRDLRQATFDALVAHNPGRDPAALLTATQKVLDRVLFVAFCEDRGLLPREIVARAYTHADPFRPRPVWDNFVALFRAVDAGSSHLDIERYNGGLFAPDPDLDALAVPDAVCEGFKKLAEYEYGNVTDTDAKLIDVEILGHIFEQSIGDLEEMHRAVASGPGPAADGPTKRKKEGAFYTPDFVTRFIVAETLGPVLRERFAAYTAFVRAATKTPRPFLDDPTTFDAAALKPKEKIALRKFWAGWLESLESVRVVDPSCGSGAFLLEAFDQLFLEYERAQGYFTALAGPTLFDIRRSILTHNLFGMDLNSEAVEIARLSCWIKTAEKGKVLTTLDANIVQGNSVVAEPDPLTAWAKRFPAAFAAGGFDVVVGNPPYVRQEWITADKPFLQRHYKSYDGVADLYVYFYELGLNLLKPGGRLGFIVTNKWMKAGYGGPLRTLYGESAWVETVVDLGHNKEVFPDADVFPCILTARKPDAGPPPESVRVCVLPREQTRVDDLSHQIADEGVSVPRSRLGAAPWNLEPPGVAALMDKLRATGVPLKEYAGASPLYGVKTGCNEAFIVDTATRDRLVAEHSSSASILKKYLRGQDIDRWCSEWSGEWMIFARKGIDIEQYPAIKRHLEQYRTQLEPKPRDWEGKAWPGRKPGSYRWYELQDAVDYYQQFDKPKLFYQVIQFHPCYSWDKTGMLGNDKTFCIPSSDLYLLGVLNSPVMWWHNWRHLVHLKDEALSPMGYLVNALPIPRPTDELRGRVAALVPRLIDLKAGQTSGVRAVLDWLQTEMGIGKVSQKLAGLIGLSADELVAEVRKLRGKKAGLSVAELKRLKDEHATTVAPLQALARESAGLERAVSDAVNAAFGLTPADIRLLWDTAPPRMPIAPPV